MQSVALRASVPVGVLLTLSLVACADADPSGSTGGSGAGGAGGSGTVTTAGAPAQPSGGSAAPNPTAGAAGGYVKPSGTGGNDDGGLFDPSMAVPFDPNAGGSGGAPVMPGTGGLNTDGLSVTSHISGNVNGTAEFTQHGVDVSVVVKLTKCPDGTLGIHINDGDSCDNTGTEGKPWDGNRGNIGDTGTITCSKNSGSMNYTRKGTDPTTNWTVGDHTRSDITPYVVIMSSAADGKSMSSFIGCGNFFK